MACDFITAGRALNCKDSVGGLKNVYFIKSGRKRVDSYRR